MKLIIHEAKSRNLKGLAIGNKGFTLMSYVSHIGKEVCNSKQFLRIQKEMGFLFLLFQGKGLR